MTALLFDLDGTLIDTIELLVDCMHHAFEGRARKPTREEWIAGIGTPLRTQLAAWADDDAMVEALVQRYRDFQELHLENSTSAYPGVVELLHDARQKGHLLGLVTSKGKGMTNRSLAHVGLTHAFDTIVTVELTTRHKPDPEPIWFALDQLGCDPRDAVFAGDSPHDMRAGAAAGVATIACTWGPYSRDDLAATNPTWWAASVPELSELLKPFHTRTRQKQ